MQKYCTLYPDVSLPEQSTTQTSNNIDFNNPNISPTPLIHNDTYQEIVDRLHLLTNQYNPSQLIKEKGPPTIICNNLHHSRPTLQ